MPCFILLLHCIALLCFGAEALLSPLDYQFRTFEITEAVVRSVINSRNSTSLVDSVEDSDRYLDDLMIESLNADTLVRSQAVTAERQRLHRREGLLLEAELKAAKEGAVVGALAVGSRVGTATGTDEFAAAGVASSDIAAASAAENAQPVSAAATEPETDVGVSPPSTAATSVRATTATTTASAGNGVDDHHLEVISSAVELIEHILLYHTRACSSQEYAAHLEGRGVFVHQNALYRSRHPTVVKGL